MFKVGGIFVCDAIAAGTIWVDMKSVGIDVLITAPQKGWSGPACCGIVLMNINAIQRMKKTVSTSFCCNLGKWLDVMDAYENGGFKYYTTLPTDALMAFQKSIEETWNFGVDNAKRNTEILGTLIREEMKKHGLVSVATDEYSSPTVVVVYCDKVDIVNAFKNHGLQVAGGVPFMCGEPDGIKTFRIGLFGIDKLKDPWNCARIFSKKLDQIFS